MHASAWRLATLHGCNKRLACGRVQVGLITLLQTKHAHEIVHIGTTKLSLLRKRLPIIVQILLTKMYYSDVVLEFLAIVNTRCLAIPY